MSFNKWAASNENPLCNSSETVKHSMRHALHAAYKAGQADEHSLWVAKIPKVPPFIFEEPSR